MAFNPERLSLIVQPIGDGGIRFFGYQTDDAEGDLVAADYFARGRDSGMRASDLVFISPEDGATDPYILVIDSVDDEGNATAVLGDSLAIGAYATESEATAGAVSNKTMSPLRTKQLVDYERTQERSFTAAQTFTTASSATTVVKLESTAADGLGGPQLDLVRNSASPAANDIVGILRVRGMNDAASEVTYANINTTILDPTAGSEDGRLILQVPVAGAQTAALSLANGAIVGAPTGSYQGTGTLNATGYYLNGTALSSTLFGVAVGTASGNLKALNADGGFTFATTATTQNFMTSPGYGGAWKSAHNFASTSADTVTNGYRTTLAATRTYTGQDDGNGDAAFFAIVTKDDLAGTTRGQPVAIRALSFNNGVDDCGLINGTAFKAIGDGTADEGGVATLELGCRRMNGSDLTDLVHWIQVLAAFSPSPASAWGGRGPIGFYSENQRGSAFAHFVGITDGPQDASVGTIDYLLAGFRTRLLADRYFSVDDQGNMEAISVDGGATAAPTWVLNRDSASPAANDALGEIVFRGQNSAAEEVDYGRLYSYINSPTDAAEYGGVIIQAMVNGSAANQIDIRNGLKIGAPAGGFLGTGTINLEGSVYIAGTKVIGARQTGWAAATGTATRTTFATSTVTLPQLAERVKALIDDLLPSTGHGLIGT